MGPQQLHQRAAKRVLSRDRKRNAAGRSAKPGTGPSCEHERTRGRRRTLPRPYQALQHCMKGKAAAGGSGSSGREGAEGGLRVQAVRLGAADSVLLALLGFVVVFVLPRHLLRILRAHKARQQQRRTGARPAAGDKTE